MDWGVRLRGTFWSRWIVPTWEARYEELAIAELVATSFSRTAVWFRLRGSSEGIGFLCETSEDILRVLEEHDVPVNPSSPGSEEGRRALPRRLTRQSGLWQARPHGGSRSRHPSRSLTRAIVPTGSGPSGLMFSTVTPASA